MDNYQDIIHLQRPISRHHAPMSMEDRAAQFAPFAALTGYDGVIRETGRLTQACAELAEDAKEELDRTFQWIGRNLHKCPRITVIWFCPDLRKKGGNYVTTTGGVRKLDLYERILAFAEGFEIPLDSIWQCRVEK